MEQETVKPPFYGDIWTDEQGKQWRSVSLWNGQFWQTRFQCCENGYWFFKQPW